MSKFFIGVKIIEVLGEAEQDGIPGYSVRYEDGYESWSPKEPLESAYFEMGDDPTKITPDMVDRFLANARVSRLDPKTVLCKGELLTGFTHYETSSCVDPENFDLSIGKDICVRRINDTIWKALGFVLQWGRFGLTGNDKSRKVV